MVKDIEVPLHTDTIPTESTEKKYKSFNKTYVYCAFGLALALIYPNKKTVMKRMVVFFVSISINFLEIFWFLVYMYRCILQRDYFNILRNMSLALIVCLFFFKTFYCNWKNDIFENLLNKISFDLVKANDLDEEYQEIYDTFIKEAKVGELCWSIIPLIFAAQYPGNAAVATIYESMKSDVGKRYMQHEMDLKFFEHVQYDTPYYEIIFAYNFLQVFILFPTFVGFDGSFCIATTHLRMKLQLITHKLNSAFRDYSTLQELRLRIKEVIRDHQEALEFHDLMQELYGGWLFAVFALSAFIISFNLYQVYLLKQLTVRYFIFLLSAVVHIFAPCHYASNLLQASDVFSISIYEAHWESQIDPYATKLLVVMIAKAQIPLTLNGKGIVEYNMQLFISIIQTAYSFFTLISS